MAKRTDKGKARSRASQRENSSKLRFKKLGKRVGGIYVSDSTIIKTESHEAIKTKVFFTHAKVK